MKTRKCSLKLFSWSLVIMLLGIFFFSVPLSSAQKNEIKIANYMDVGTLDPGYMTSMMRDYVVMDCIFDGLLKFEEGSWKTVPDLAESWDVSKDNLNITFHLRKGVQFHKGYGEMTAEDVKFTYDRMLAPGSDAPVRKHIDFVDHLEVLDKYTVKMVLKRPAAQLFTLTLPTHTGFIISKKAFEKIGKDKFAMDPVGCGPYEFELWEPKSRIVLKAFKDYWRGKPKIEKVVFLPIPDDRTREVALKTGEIDVAYTTLTHLQSLRRHPGIDVFIYPALQWRWIGFTHNKPPFDNLKLRQAFRYAVDVDEILRVVYLNEAKRINAILPEGTLGYWKDAPVYKQDLTKARQLLKEGGKPDGFKATVNVANLDIAKAIAEIIISQAAKVGIDLSVEINEIGAFNEGLKSGRYNMFIERWSNDVDPYRIMRYFVSDDMWNITHWKNKEYDDLVQKASAELDPKKRAEMYVGLQQIMDEACYAVYITNEIMAQSAQKYVNMGKPYPHGMVTPWTMSFK